MKGQQLATIINIIKKSAQDIWEEALYLIIFNIVWFFGALLVITFPFFTFGLFFTVYDISQGRGISFRTFIGHARQMWKQAYIWGGINLGVFVLAWVNLTFYSQLEARWAAIVQMVIIALTTFWAILQLITLAIYPRLKEPGFKLALRNAAAVVGLQPLPIFSLIAIIVLLGIVTLLFQAIGFLAVTAIIAVVTNRTVEAILQQAMAKEQEAAGEEERNE